MNGDLEEQEFASTLRARAACMRRCRYFWRRWESVSIALIGQLLLIIHLALIKVKTQNVSRVVCDGGVLSRRRDVIISV
jgi:hypothetical protein